MRHHVTIGITDKGETIALCTADDREEHRAVLADLEEKRGQKSQRQRFVRAFTLSTDHYIATRRFPIRNDLIDATPAKPAPTEPATSPSEPAGPSADLPPRFESTDSKSKGARK
jgi:hypothetical protein